MVDLKAIADEAVVTARTRECKAVVVAVMAPDGSWFVSASGGIECLGLAHQAVRSVEGLIDQAAGKARSYQVAVLPPELEVMTCPHCHRTSRRADACPECGTKATGL